MNPQSPQGLPKRIETLLTKAGIPIEKNAIVDALGSGKISLNHWPPSYGLISHRKLCSWAGVDPGTIALPKHNAETEVFPDIGLSYRAWRMLNRSGIPTTKEAVTKALNNGDLLAGKRPSGYGGATHAEMCRWVGIDPKALRAKHLMAKKK